MKYILSLVLLSFALFLGPQALANDDAPSSSAVTKQGAFIKKRYRIKGGWEIATNRDGQTVIHFDDDFKTKGGPDLKVFLSQTPVEQLSGVTAINSAVKLSVLKSNRGRQSYIVPDDIDVADYSSVIIHCEAYSVLWGGFDIAATPSDP